MRPDGGFVVAYGLILLTAYRMEKYFPQCEINCVFLQIEIERNAYVQVLGSKQTKAW